MFRFPLICVLLLAAADSNAELVFYEDVGTTASAGGQSIVSYGGFTSGLTFEGNNAEAIAITPGSQQSSGYSGASGASQIGLLQNSSESTDLIIRGIDTTSYVPNSFDLSFGLRKSLSSGFFTPIAVLATTNDVDFSTVFFPTTSSTSNWQFRQGTDLDIPSHPNVSLYFSKSPGFTAPIDVYLDDIRLEADVNVVPEPSSMALASLALSSLVFLRRRI